jgi:hypothetical protein
LDFARHLGRVSANTRFETLMDVGRHGHGVEVRCACGRRVVLDGDELWGRFIKRGWNTRLHMVGDRLRCTACGRRRPSVRVTGTRG